MNGNNVEAKMRSYQDKYNMNPMIFIKWGLILALIIILLGNLFGSIRSVKAGTVQVVTQFGKVTGRVLSPGLNFIVPFVEKTLTYNTKKVTYETADEASQKSSKADYKDYPVDTTTEDGQGVQLTYTIRFRVDGAKATWLANNIGSEEAIVEKVVKTDSRAWTRTIVRDFTSTDLYSGNIRKVQDKIFDTLEEKFADNGLILDELVLREPRFAVDYEKVMEAKQVALEQVKVEEHKATQEEFKKQQTITRAEAQAKEQELQRATISDELLEKMWIEAWREGGSQVPNFMCGDSGNMFFNIPQ